MHTIFFKIDVMLISCTFSFVRCHTRSFHCKCYSLKYGVLFSGNIWRESNMHYSVADIVTLRISTQNCDTYIVLFLYLKSVCWHVTISVQSRCIPGPLGILLEWTNSCLFIVLSHFRYLFHHVAHIVTVIALETWNCFPLLPCLGTFLHCVVRFEVITLPSWILWEFQVQIWMTNTLQNCSIATIPLVRTDTAHQIPWWVLSFTCIFIIN